MGNYSKTGLADDILFKNTLLRMVKLLKKPPWRMGKLLKNTLEYAFAEDASCVPRGLPLAQCIGV